MITGLEGKRHAIIYQIDRCIALADRDPVRALAAIDEARKGLQAISVEIEDAHRGKARPRFAADVDAM